MTEVATVGADLARNVFHLHGAASDGSVVFRKKLTRARFQRYMAAQPSWSWPWRLAVAPSLGSGDEASGP